MKISFNPSTVAALTLPPKNKDITFDLRGHNIFARGVEFKGTDTNTWRSVTINGTSLGTKTLELKNGSNISITANGTISANGLASSSHTHPLVINGKSFSLGTTSLNLGTYVPWTSNGYTLSVSTKSGNDIDTGGGLYIDAYTGTLFYLWLHDTSNVWYKKTASGSWKKMDAGNADTWGGYSAKLTSENTSGTKILVVDGTNVQYRTLSSILAGHNTWRTILINGTNIGTNVLNLKNGSNIILSNTNGQVTISASGLASSDHSHDDRYLKLAGGTMVGDIYFSGDNKICWSRNTDSASISFKNTKDGDTDSYMSFVTSDNGNEYFRWSRTSGTNIEWMSLKADGLRIKGTKVSLENHLHIVTINGTTKTISNSTIDLGYYLPQNGQIAGWGTLTNANGYSAITHFDLGAKGAFALAGKNNQMFMLLDGTIYVNEGSQEVATKLWVENKGYVTGSVVGRTITINGTSTTWQNTWRDIKINNSSISNNTLNIIQGDNITISNSNGTARISTTGLASSNHTHSFITTIGKTTIDSTSYTANRFNTIFYYNSNGPTTYGNILSVVDLYNGGGLLALPWSGSQTKADGTDTAVERLKYRSKRDCVGGWTIWKTIPYMDDLTWDNITNKPSTFTPSQHLHTWQSITDKIVASNEFNIVNSGYKNTMWFNYLPIDDRNKSATITLYVFGNGNKGHSSLLASGYVKNGSDDNYVLLGGGGHKALSDLSNSHNHDGRYHLNHVALWDFTLKHNRAYVTFDLSGTSLGWVNGFVSTHSDYLSSYIVNTHRTANWYVGYSENESTTEPTWYKLIHSGNYTEFAAKADHTHSQYIKRTGDTMYGALNFANGTWNLVGDDSYVGDCNVGGHFGIKAANTTYPGIAFYNNDNTLLGKLTAYSDNIKYKTYSLQFLDNGNTTVTSSIWTNPFDTYNANAVANNLAICVWGQASKLAKLSNDTGDMSLWLRRISASLATLNMVLDGEYYANGNLRLAHVSELPSKSSWNYDDVYLKLNGTNTMLGNLNLHSHGSSYIGKGGGDKSGSDYTDANIVIRSWWGITFKSYDNVNRTYLDTRTGNFGTKGSICASSFHHLNNDSNDYVILAGGGTEKLSSLGGYHTHGLLHSSLATTIDKTTTGGWSLINESYNGFILKSLRMLSDAPNWLENNYAAGIVFGGADTKGVVSVAYNTPAIRIAGGNGSTPVWWIRVIGANGKTYNLDNFLTSHQSLANYVTLSTDLTITGLKTIDRGSFGALVIKRSDDTNGVSIQFRGKSAIYGYIGFNNVAKDGQALRWNSNAGNFYQMLDTSSTYIKDSKITINNTTISPSLVGHTHTSLAAVGNVAIDATTYGSGLNFRPYYNNGGPSTFGNILEYVSSGSGGSQLAMEWSGGQTKVDGTDTNVGRLYYRSKRDNQKGWTAWKKVAWTTDVPSSLKSPYAFDVFGVSYDGSSAKSVTKETFISTLGEATATITDGTMLITSYASDNGFSDSNAKNVPYKRKASALWNYIKGKTDSLYSAKTHSHTFESITSKPTTIQGYGITNAVYRKTLIYGQYNLLFTFTRGTEKGYLDFYISGAYNSGQFFRRCRLEWSYSTNTEKTLTAYTLENLGTTCDVTITRTSGTSEYKVYLSLASGALIGEIVIISYVSVDKFDVTPKKVDSVPTATYNFTQPTIGTLVSNADKLDGYHASSAQKGLYGNIPIITTSGVMEIGHYIDFHYDNTTGSDYSTRLYTTGNHSNTVALPSKTGTLALTSDIPTSLKNPNAIKFKNINGSEVSYDGSSAVDLTAGTYIAKLPYGFASFTSGATWGNTTGTSFASWNDSTGGSIDFRRDNPSSGKMSIKVDGRVYVNEGSNPVISSSYDNGFWGLRTPDGKNDWIRTPNAGLIPYILGKAGSGHSSLGTNSWYFSTAYIDKVYGSLKGNADTATKLETARTISGGTDIRINYSFDGSDNPKVSLGFYSCNITTGNVNNYPFRRIAKLDTITSLYTDRAITLYLTADYNGGKFGIIKISLRTNNANSVSTAEARWLVRSGFALDDIQIGLYNVFGATYADVFFTKATAWTGILIRDISSGARGSDINTWTLVSSKEVSDTTTSNKLTSTECYTSVANAATLIHSKAYTNIITSVDDGTVLYSNYAWEIKDSNNSDKNITVTYSKAALSSTSYLASWNGYELGSISPSKLSVNYANSAGSIKWSNVTEKPSLMIAEEHSGKTIEDILKAVLGISPRLGSSNLTNDSRISNAWWNYLYIPHRTGIDSDNPNYGTLLLFPMTSKNSSYIVRSSAHNVVSELAKIYTDKDKPTKSDVGLGNVDNTADADKSVKYATSAGNVYNGTITITLGGTTKGTFTVNQNTNTTINLSDNNTWRPLGTGATDAAAGNHTHTFASITNKPTTLSGYGITDGVNTVTVSGSGNAVTSASISGHTITLTKGATYLTSHQSLSNYYTKAETDSKYLKLSGGTMTGQISMKGSSNHWYDGRDTALIRVSTLSGYSTLSSMKTTNGSWEIGAYNDSSYADKLCLTYVTDTNYNSKTNTYKQILFNSDASIRASKFDSGSTSSTFVKGDGSLDSTTYISTSTITNYYWANVKISATSNSSTYPTFGNVNINSTGLIQMNGSIALLNNGSYLHLGYGNRNTLPTYIYGSLFNVYLKDKARLQVLQKSSGDSGYYYSTMTINGDYGIINLYPDANAKFPDTLATYTSIYKDGIFTDNTFGNYATFKNRVSMLYFALSDYSINSEWLTYNNIAMYTKDTTVYMHNVPDGHIVFVKAMNCRVTYKSQTKNIYMIINNEVVNLYNLPYKSGQDLLLYGMNKVNITINNTSYSNATFWINLTF